MRTRILLVLLVLGVSGVPAQEIRDPRQNPIVARPTFAPEKGPVVAIDEAHKNTHTYAGRQRAFVQLLQSDGYRVRPFTDTISIQSLQGVDVLFMANPGGWGKPEDSLTDSEVTTLLEWVQGGGSLLLILDHWPRPGNNEKLAAALGVTSWHNGYVMVEVPGTQPVGPVIFWRQESLPPSAPAVATLPDGKTTAYQGADAVLAQHVILEGRNSDEWVQRVTTFVGSAFKTAAKFEPLLILPRRAISIIPKSPGNPLEVESSRSAVGGWLQGAVIHLGKGRVGLFGETGLFSAGPAPDNRKFALNLLHWLTKVL